jgi:hypothetical protein
MGEALNVWRGRIYGKALYLLLNFAEYLKLLIIPHYYNEILEVR